MIKGVQGFFILLGIIFFGIMIHEVFHIFHIGNSEGVCMTWNSKISDDTQKGYLFAFAQFDISKFDNVKEFNDLRSLSEKYTLMLENYILIIIAFMMGYYLKTKKITTKE